MIAGGTKESATTAARRASNIAKLLRDHAALPDHKLRPRPAWSATSKLLRASGSSSFHRQPASQGSSERWAELETGSSSAGP